MCCNPCSNSWDTVGTVCSGVLQPLQLVQSFGVVCMGVLQGLHQHLVWCAQACCKVYIIIWCSVHEHVARVTSTFGAVCMGVLRKGYIHSWCSVQGYGMHWHVVTVAVMTLKHAVVCCNSCNV